MPADLTADWDKASFEGLYQRLAPRLVAFLLASGTEIETASDIVQEAFLRLWRNRDKLVRDEASVRGLAFTTIRNLRTDEWRKNARLLPIEDALEIPSPPVPSPGDLRYLRRRLTAAFAKLPVILRETYLLFQVVELPVREIALRTATTEANVKVRIHRAKKRLAAELADLM